MKVCCLFPFFNHYRYSFAECVYSFFSTSRYLFSPSTALSSSFKKDPHPENLLETLVLMIRKKLPLFSVSSRERKLLLAHHRPSGKHKRRTLEQHVFLRLHSDSHNTYTHTLWISDDQEDGFLKFLLVMIR